MRNLVGIALVALVLSMFALLFLTQNPAQKEEGASSPLPMMGEGPVSFGIDSAHIADYKGGKVAVLNLYLYPEGEKGRVAVFCSGAPLQKNMLVLEHASAPGIGGELAELVAGELSRCGFSSRRAQIQDALNSENSVIIAPNGAVPGGIWENIGMISSSNSRAVALVSLPGRLVLQNGTLVGANGSLHVIEVDVVPGEEARAAFAAASEALLPAGEQILEAEMAGGNLTLAVPLSSNSSFCRALFHSQSGSCRTKDSLELEAMPGSLSGPSSLLSGHKGNFEFSLGGEGEVGRSLRFYARLLAGREEISRQEIAGGKISGGWASLFSLTAPRGGSYVLVVHDQFGREHAKAYFESVALSITNVSQQGTRLEFLALYGGKPVNGAVRVSLDGGPPKEYYSSNGTLVVFASPFQGRHSLTFSYGGVSTETEFFHEGVGLVEAYAKLGLIALAILLAAFLLLSAKRKAKYRIAFPQKAPGSMVEIFASPSDLVQAWQAFDRKNGGHGLPCTANELSGELSRMLKSQGGQMPSAESTWQVLEELCEHKIFSGSGGLFIPTKSLDGFTPEQAASLRLIHDLLLERGIGFRKSGRIRVRQAKIELALFKGAKGVLEGMGREKRAVVFTGRPEQAEFEKSLSQYSPQSARIKIALSNGKLLFVSATRQELQGLLP